MAEAGGNMRRGRQTERECPLGTEGGSLFEREWPLAPGSVSNQRFPDRLDKMVARPKESWGPGGGALNEGDRVGSK